MSSASVRPGLVLTTSLVVDLSFSVIVRYSIVKNLDSKNCTSYPLIYHGGGKKRNRRFVMESIGTDATPILNYCFFFFFFCLWQGYHGYTIACLSLFFFLQKDSRRPCRNNELYFVLCDFFIDRIQKKNAATATTVRDKNSSYDYGSSVLKRRRIELELG